MGVAETTFEFSTSLGDLKKAAQFISYVCFEQCPPTENKLCGHGCENCWAQWLSEMHVWRFSIDGKIDIVYQADAQNLCCRDASTEGGLNSP